MTTYCLLHGAGSDSWYWHLVVPELQARGHEAIAVDLPSDDDASGLDDYAEVILQALGSQTEPILVAQSLAGFIAPLVCVRRPVALLVLVNAMVPRPGETAREWWSNTGHDFPEPFDPVEVFLHDVPEEVAAESARHVRRQADKVFEQPWPLDAWPPVPTRAIASQDDRLFPIDFQRRVIRDRLGIDPDEMPGGHLPALSRPLDLANRLEAYRGSLI